MCRLKYREQLKNHSLSFSHLTFISPRKNGRITTKIMHTILMANFTMEEKYTASWNKQMRQHGQWANTFPLYIDFKDSKHHSGP